MVQFMMYVEFARETPQSTRARYRYMSPRSSCTRIKRNGWYLKFVHRRIRIYVYTVLTTCMKLTTAVHS
jgi:hypothetical protein